MLIVHYGAKYVEKKHWVFRDDYLKCINSKAITQIIQTSLNRSIIVDIIDINVNINHC